MLNNLPSKKKIMLIAHNSNYDCRFILKYLKNIEPPIDKNNRFIQIKGEFWKNNGEKINIIIKDSCKLIPMPLSDFGKCFKLNVNKEVMPYDLYTEKNINKIYVNIDDGINIIKNQVINKYYKKEKENKEIKESIEQFLNNINLWNCKNVYGDKFNIIKYSSEYCKLDCHVLRLGYETYKDWMYDLTELNIDNFITI